MFVPSSPYAALATALVATICWGNWSVPFKFCQDKISFEGFYFTFSIGILTASLVLALTLGQGGERALMDVLGQVSAARFAGAFFGGVVFNIANLGLCKSIEMMGLAVAFPLCIGMALVVGTLVNYAIAPSGNVLLLVTGIVLGLAAVCGVAFVQVAKEKDAEEKESRPKLAAAGDEELRAHDTNSTARSNTTTPAGPFVPGTYASDVEIGMAAVAPNDVEKVPSGESPCTNPSPTFRRKMIVTVVSGVLMSFWSPLSVLAIKDDLQDAGVALTPYGEYLIFCLAIMLSTLLLIPAILRCPLEGGAARQFSSAFRDFRGVAWSTHGLCLMAGAIWGVGGNANIVGAASNDLSPAVSYGIGQAAPMMAIFWGVLLFKEFADTSAKVKASLVLVVLLFLAAIASFFASMALGA